MTKSNVKKYIQSLVSNPVIWDKSEYTQIESTNVMNSRIRLMGSEDRVLVSIGKLGDTDPYRDDPLVRTKSEIEYWHKSINHLT